MVTTPSQTQKPDDALWEYLKAWFPNDADDRRSNITLTVNYCAKLRGCDTAEIYDALCAGVRLRREHKARLYSNETERGIAKRQRQVWQALNEAVKSVDEWNRVWRTDERDYIDNNYIDVDGPGHNSLTCLRALRDSFWTHTVPLDDDTRGRLQARGRPWVAKRRTEDLLRRANVPVEERKALLKDIGLL
jgi:hypothetical protein